MTDPDGVSRVQPRRCIDATAVHERAVRGAEVLDLDAVFSGPQRCVATGQLRVVQQDIRALAAEDDCVLDLECLPGSVALGDDEASHGVPV